MMGSLLEGGVAKKMGLSPRQLAVQRCAFRIRLLRSLNTSVLDCRSSPPSGNGGGDSGFLSPPNSHFGAQAVFQEWQVRNTEDPSTPPKEANRAEDLCLKKENKKTRGCQNLPLSPSCRAGSIIQVLSRERQTKKVGHKDKELHNSA